MISNDTSAAPGASAAEMSGVWPVAAAVTAYRWDGRLAAHHDSEPLHAVAATNPREYDSDYIKFG